RKKQHDGKRWKSDKTNQQSIRAVSPVKEPVTGDQPKGDSENGIDAEPNKAQHQNEQGVDRCHRQLGSPIVS
ncbi:MAG TPA: hypothetical protein DIW81_10415, partial [Planctomycetaceae bacterium]|nr:hypothetical protein [Planctomycetaceae bacterium]